MGRVSYVDMDILDLTDAAVSEDDPRYRREIKRPSDYHREDKLRMYYLDEIDDIYYVSLESFASIFEDDIVNGLRSSCTEENGISTWTLKRGIKIVYQIVLDPFEKTMSVDGLDMNTYIINSINTGNSGLGRYCSTSTSFVEGHENTTRVYSFGDYGFETFEANGHYCYPFALLSAELSRACDRSFLFLSATQEIIEYGAKEQISLTKFKNPDDTEISAEQYIQNAYDSLYGSGLPGEYPVEPYSLREFNMNLFYFIMDNYYGISDEKGIKSMRSYFEAFEDSDAFLSENGTNRGNAYFKLIQMLNDLHTAYTYSPYFGEFGDSEGIYSQTLYRIRMDLVTFLKDLRQSAIDDYNDSHNTNFDETNVRYSSDGRYGYFSFDSFSTYHTFNDWFIPENVLNQDTFNLFVKNLNECKQNGVERVIIDDSCNSGGYVINMLKLLGLLSKNNDSTVYIQGGDNNSIQKIDIKVDSNKDGYYDETDSFGNDFEFYIVTSNFSYSCGNAFPFCAASTNYAKTIGQKSGGGECCVYGFNFPSGQGLKYSSPFHLGFYGNDDTFRGAEVGTFTQFDIGNGFHDFYNVDTLAAHIEEVEGQGMPFGPF